MLKRFTLLFPITFLILLTNCVFGKTEIKRIETTIPHDLQVVALSADKSFAEQVNQPNTIYEIRSTFDLGGKNVVIPQNCVLRFEGGVLSNGSVVGQQTRIEASPIHLFSETITLSGTWDVVECYPEWFGAQGDGKHDDGPALRSALASPFRVIRLLGTNVYGVGSYADAKNKIGLKTYHDNTCIIGINKGTEENRSPQIKALYPLDFNILFQVCNRSTVLSGFQFYGYYSKAKKGFTDYNVKTGITVSNGDKMLGYLQLENIEIGYVSEDAYNLSVYCCEIRNCLARYCNRGFVFDGKKSTVTSCLLSNCYVIASKHDAYYAYRTYYSNFVQCYADFCGYDHLGGEFDKNDISPVFHIVNSQAINFIGCGSEQSAKVALCDLSDNIVFQGGHFNVCHKAHDPEINNYIDLNRCKSISFLGCYLYETQKSKIRVRATDCENIAMIRCIYLYNTDKNNFNRGCIVDGSSLILLSESMDETCNSNTRPQGLTNDDIGFRVFDTDLNKPIWWSSCGWVDATGNSIE